MITNLVARKDRGDILEAVLETMDCIRGAYALIIMTGDKLIGVRDPNGIRPKHRQEERFLHAILRKLCL